MTATDATSAADEGAQPLLRVPLWRTSWRFGGQQPVGYAGQWLMWIVFHSLPAAPGLFLRSTLDRVAAGRDPWLPLAGLLAVEVGTALLFSIGIIAFHRWHGRITVGARANLLHAVARAPGPGTARLPEASGATVGRFVHDVENFYWFVDIQLDIAGGAVFTILATGVLAATDGRVAAVVFVPAALTVLLSRAADPRIRRARAVHREAATRLSAFVAETFGNVLAIKSAGAEPAVLGRFNELAAERRRYARRDRVLEAAVLSASSSTMTITIGLVLLVVAPAMRSGSFTVGDLGLVTSYAAALSAVPQWIAGLLARRTQAAVNLGRLAPLLPERDPLGLTSRLPVDDRSAVTEPLDVLEIRGLTVAHPGTGRGVVDVDLTVRRGEVVAVTGPVGSGKSTLLAGVLGLVGRDAGTITWNGRTIDDPSTVLTPPRAAYVPQVPRLFSESLEANVRLGADAVSPEDVAAAVEAAALADDVALFTDGLDTRIGPRGTRLSGGQVLRAATARALVRRPDLLLVDDVSSALDGDTEERLWRGVLRPGATVLVVTHRPQVLAAADRVLHLAEGRVERVEERVTEQVRWPAAPSCRRGRDRGRRRVRRGRGRPATPRPRGPTR